MHPSNRALLSSIFGCLLLASAFSVGSVQADIVGFTVDPSQSYVDVSVDGSPLERSATSGNGLLDLASLSPPFGTAQLSDVDLILDDGLTFSLVGGLVTATTSPGNVHVYMVVPGAAGVVTGGLFDQTNNEVELSGDMQVLDPLNLLGGDQTIDLATLMPAPIDFIDVSLVRSGNTITISADYEIHDTLDFNGNNVSIDLFGTVVAHTVAVPEPSSFMMVATCSLLALKRRRRSN